MGIRFQCPNGHPLHVKDFLAGKRGICPECDAKFLVPKTSGGQVDPVGDGPAMENPAEQSKPPSPVAQPESPSPAKLPNTATPSAIEPHTNSAQHLESVSNRSTANPAAIQITGDPCLSPAIARRTVLRRRKIRRVYTTLWLSVALVILLGALLVIMLR